MHIHSAGEGERVGRGGHPASGGLPQDTQAHLPPGGLGAPYARGAARRAHWPLQRLQLSVPVIDEMA